jgi:hypothetical protein
MTTCAITLDELTIEGPPKFSPLWESASLAAISRALRGHKGEPKEGNKLQRKPAKPYNAMSPAIKAGKHPMREDPTVPGAKKPRKAMANEQVNPAKDLRAAAQHQHYKHDLKNQQAPQASHKPSSVSEAGMPDLYEILLLGPVHDQPDSPADRHQQSSIEQEIQNLAKYSDGLLQNALAARLV